MNIKSRKLLSPLLAVLFALSIIIGVIFLAPKTEKISASAESAAPFTKTELNALAQAATYNDYSVMCTAVRNGTTLNASNFGSYVVTFGGYDWWPVELKNSGNDIVLTLWLKTSVGNYTWSDGTWGANSTYSSNNYKYSWIRSAINMGQTSDGGDYYGLWSGSNQPKLFHKDDPPNNTHVAPTAFTAFSSIVGNQFVVKGGDYDDYLWLPSIDEAVSGGSWGCTSTQWSSTGTSTYCWTRSPNPNKVYSAYVLNLSGVTDYINGTVVYDPYGIRPAINVKVEASAAEPEDVEKEYKGTPYTLADITGSWYDSTKMQIDLPTDMTNAGEKKVKVTLNATAIADDIMFAGTPDTSIGEDEYTRYFNFTIKPKPVQISWATQNHEEDSGGDSFYFMLPSLNVTADVQQLLTDVQYYLKSNYDTSTGIASGLPVTTFEQGKDYYAVVQIKSGIDKNNYSFSGNPYCLFNTTDNRTAVVVKIENSGGTYDGKQHAATAKAEKTDGTPLVVGTDIDFLLTYYKDGDSVYENGSINPPTNAGTYKLVVSIKPAYVEDFKPYDSMEFEYVIEKAEPVCNPVRKGTATTLYVGSVLPEIVAGNLSDTKGTYVWNEGQSILLGENTYYYTFTPTDSDNYKEYQGEFKLTGIEANVKTISAEFTLPEGVTIYDSFSLDDLMQYLTVSGELDNGETIDELYGYTITGTLTAGDSTLTVHYGENDLTCRFTVEGVVACVLEGITADFSQDGTVYTSTDLEDLKSMLTVKGKYNDGRDYGAIAPSDYDLIIDGDELVVGAAEITVSYWYEGVEYTTTFKVTVKAVALESLTAVFNPGLNEIKSSTSLEKLKSWLTVTGTNNDGTDYGEISADDYTLTGTLKGGTTSTITVKYQGKSTTFTVEVAESVDDALKTPIPVPDLKEISYTGSEIDILQGWAHTALVDIVGNKYTDAGTYTLTLVIKDADTYKWDTTGLTPVAMAKALVKYALAEEFVGCKIDGDTLTAEWTIAQAVLKGTWNAYGTLDVVSSSYKGPTDGLFTYKYYDKDGNEVNKLIVGADYKVEAELIDTKNFVLDSETAQLTGAPHEFTMSALPSSGLAAAWNTVKTFMTKPLLGLPVWLWFVIALAVLILLIIIIAVACKRRKNKEEREEAKARKEEERQRKEEERQRREEERQAQKERLEEERRLQKEKLDAERELAKAKQEAELEKIRMQAGMAGAGMASMAMQQPQPQPQPQPQQMQATDNSAIHRLEMELAEMRAKLAAQQAQPAAQPSAADNSAIMRLEMELAEMRAKLAAVQQSQPVQQAPMQMPMQYQQPTAQHDGALDDIKAQLAVMRAEQQANKELNAMKTELEIAKYASQHNQPHGYTVYEQQPQQIPAGRAVGGAELLGDALIAAFTKIMSQGRAVREQSAPAAVIPQNVEESTQSSHAQYPPDAVITTTTTVDRTNGKPTTRGRNDSTNFDVDGFYDKYE